MREVQQAERRQQQVSELRQRIGAAALSAGHSSVPNSESPHPIPAFPRTKLPAEELLQTGYNHEGTPRGDSADPGLVHQGNSGAPEQRQVPSVSRDVELLRSQKPAQREEGGRGSAARAQRPQ